MKIKNKDSKNKVWITYNDPDIHQEITLSFPCIEDAKSFLNSKNVSLDETNITNTYPMHYKPNKDQLENMMYMYGKVVEQVNKEDVSVCN